MSKESSKWLNTMTLIGNVLKRGKAWHWRESEQEGETNHYDGFVPVEDVRRRLFDWSAVETPVFVKNDDGNFVEIQDRKAVMHDKTKKVFGVFSNRFNIHQYDDALLKNLEQIIDSNELGIDSAGLLQEGGKAWVQISVPENVTTADGFTFRPTLLASTAHNGSLATTYRRVMQAVVCDNTLEMALNESTKMMFKIRHKGTASFDGRIEEVRDALEIIYQTSDEMVAELNALTAWAVTDNQFTKLVEQMTPIAVGLGTNDQPSKKSVTMQTTKREALQNLWRADERVLPWKNTGLGVVQAFTTYNQHIAGTDAKRVGRNYNKLVNGQQATEDALVLERLRELTLV
jgi:phage/plasmid-like protein (TIGR03299 family)